MVNQLVVPEPSDLCTTEMGWFGKVRSGLSDVIDASFQFAIVPRKMLARTGPVSFKPVVIPGRL